mmetsp:Transcript_28132/g.96868  ORF Transcript_28132/g.96868 Transcript_28132/m.96868 type:complete len:325 (-) Transcript_28132:1220-2194(-)
MHQPPAATCLLRLSKVDLRFLAESVSLTFGRSAWANARQNADRNPFNGKKGGESTSSSISTPFSGFAAVSPSSSSPKPSNEALSLFAFGWRAAQRAVLYSERTLLHWKHRASSCRISESQAWQTSGRSDRRSCDSQCIQNAQPYCASQSRSHFDEGPPTSPTRLNLNTLAASSAASASSSTRSCMVARSRTRLSASKAARACSRALALNLFDATCLAKTRASIVGSPTSSSSSVGAIAKRLFKMSSPKRPLRFRLWILAARSCAYDLTSSTAKSWPPSTVCSSSSNRASASVPAARATRRLPSTLRNSVAVNSEQSNALQNSLL